MSEATQAGERLLTPNPTRGMTVLNLPLRYTRSGEHFSLWSAANEYLGSIGDPATAAAIVERCNGNLTAEPAGEGEWRDWAVKELSDTRELEGDSDSELRRKLSMVLHELAIAANGRLTPSPPEVIEWQGQVVLTEAKWRSAYMLIVEAESIIKCGRAYEALQLLKQFVPEPPPRSSFTAPPKPELVLCRDCNGNYEWMTPKEYQYFGTDSLKQIDETTGKVIQGE